MSDDKKYSTTLTNEDFENAKLLSDQQPNLGPMVERIVSAIDRKVIADMGPEKIGLNGNPKPEYFQEYADRMRAAVNEPWPEMDNK